MTDSTNALGQGASVGRQQVSPSWSGSEFEPPLEFQPGDPTLQKLNPITKILAAALLTTPIIFTLDWLSASCLLVIGVVTGVCVGLKLSTVFSRVWPVLLIAPFSSLNMLLYAKPGGEIYWSFGLINISQNSVELAIAMAVRVLAVGLPSLVLLGSIDPTRLGDALSQILKLPARFVLGTVAGVRLMGVLVVDWEAMRQARKARGVGDGGAIGRFFGMSFSLLVLAIRRGSGLATAMEARGFGRDSRSWARPSALHVQDIVLIVAAGVAPWLAIWVATAAGTIRFIGTGGY